MEVFVARQPIFDRKQRIVAYELLFRNNSNSNFAQANGDAATYEVMVNSFILIGLNLLTDGKTAFVNFTENSILNEIPTLLPKENLTVEILESVKPSAAVIEACKVLKSKGYTLALDDFEYDSSFDQLINLVDIIKVDFILTRGSERRTIIEKFKGKGIKFLAEKVETKEEYCEAIEMGYSYFQGYFFSRPTILKSNDIPINNATKINTIRKLNNSNIDIDDIEQIVKRDMSLSYKIFKYANSSYFGFKDKPKSIKQILVLLGKKESIKWLNLVMLTQFQVKENGHFIRLSLIRARFCELICMNTYNPEKSSEAFIMGMFSTIDSVLGKDMEDALNELAVTDEVKVALLGRESFLRYILNAALCYEEGQWGNFSTCCKKIKIDENHVPNYYVKSLEWTREIFKV